MESQEQQANIEAIDLYNTLTTGGPIGNTKMPKYKDDHLTKVPLDQFKSLIPARKYMDMDWSRWPKQKPLLHEAARVGRTDICKYLVEELKVEIDHVSGKSFTPLHYAYCYDHEDVIDYLISQGANENIKNKFGETPANVNSRIEESNPWKKSIIVNLY